MTDLAPLAMVIFGTGAGAQLLVKVLGPTAEYLGDELKTWAEKRRANIGSIIQNAGSKLDAASDTGAVPPRVLARILTEGSFSDDQVAVEYLGGVLASSKTEISRDDRGAALVSMIGRMSTYELRIHYILYSAARHVLLGTDVDFGINLVRTANRIFIPMRSYVDAMEFSASEDSAELGGQAIWGLYREDLIAGDFAFGSARTLRSIVPELAEEGILFTTTVPGAELFLWAHGYGKLGVQSFLDPSIKYPPVLSVGLEGVRRVGKGGGEGQVRRPPGPAT